MTENDIKEMQNGTAATSCRRLIVCLVQLHTLRVSLSLFFSFCLCFLPSHLITLYSPFGSSPFSMMRASSSSLGNSRHNAMRMCTNAAVGPPCVHSARSVPPRASSSRPSWGASVQRRSLAPVANLMPSFAKFPTCQAYKCEIAIS